MTAAQKKARDNFKKAIAYRKKFGCTLKEAFLQVYGKKVGAVKKKAAPKKKAAKKAAPKKKAMPKSLHKDTKSHNVNIRVMSGIEKLHSNSINDYKNIISEIAKHEYDIKILKHIFPKLSPSDKIKVKAGLKKEMAIIKEKKIHARELKKLI